VLEVLSLGYSILYYKDISEIQELVDTAIAASVEIHKSLNKIIRIYRDTPCVGRYIPYVAVVNLVTDEYTGDYFNGKWNRTKDFRDYNE